MISVELNREIYSSLKENSIFFLKRGIRELNEHTSNNTTSLTVEGAKISYLFLQTALELAIKAYLIKFGDIDSIIFKKKNKVNIPLNTEDLRMMFEKGKLKFISLESLKQFIVDKLNNEQLSSIEDFQKFRNETLHFSPNFVEEDLFDFNYDFIYFIVHVILPILSDFNHDEHAASASYQKILNHTDFLNLIDLPIYIEKMRAMAKEESSNVFHCPNCWKETFGIEEGRCYCCTFEDFDNIQLGYADCIKCRASSSVVYNKLNIRDNDDIWVNSKCLNCKDCLEVFRCPNCEEAYAFEIENDLNKCTPKNCVNC